MPPVTTPPLGRSLVTFIDIPLLEVHTVFGVVDGVIDFQLAIDESTKRIHHNGS